MSIAHPSGNDLESMSEFYNNFFLRAVTLVYLPLAHICPLHVHVQHGDAWRVTWIGLSETKFIVGN